MSRTSKACGDAVSHAHRSALPAAVSGRTPRPTTVWDIVRARARESPQAVAIAAPGRMPLCFQDLDRHIASLAAVLGGLGIRRNSRVAVMLPNGPEMASACLAIASCATCAPLDAGTAAEQLEWLFTDLQAGTLFVQQGCGSPAAAIARGRGMQVIEIIPRASAPAGLFALSATDLAPVQSKAHLARPEDLALVLHTSGTTARPKQVQLTHANLCASAHAVATALQLSVDDRCLNVLPLFHIHGLVAALLASLSAGASVACTPGLARGDFFAWLAELHPTWYTAVPAMHQAILAAAPDHLDAIRRTPLRFIRSSSAALPARVAQGLERCFDAPVIEAYGMTEAAHQIATNALPPGLRKPKSVGRAVGNDVAVMDAAARLLAADETGEIVVRGPNVTRGYANNDDANAASFTAGWFRTGDQGYIDADGYIFLTGRLKEIVNRGGEKLSLREIDEALLDHPSVAQAVAFRVPHPTLGEDVAAALVLVPGAATSPDEIRAFLLGRLATFKIPHQLLVVDAIPAGATGKTDRNKLHALLAERLKPKFVAPRDAIEAQVAAIFTEVTGTAPIGVDDNFFALGGDSLQGFRVIARIRSALQVSLSIVDLFRVPTVAQIARVVAQARSGAEALALDRVLREMGLEGTAAAAQDCPPSAEADCAQKPAAGPRELAP